MPVIKANTVSADSVGVLSPSRDSASAGMARQSDRSRARDVTTLQARVRTCPYEDARLPVHPSTPARRHSCAGPVAGSVRQIRLFRLPMERIEQHDRDGGDGDRSRRPSGAGMYAYAHERTLDRLRTAQCGAMQYCIRYDTARKAGGEGKERIPGNGRGSFACDGGGRLREMHSRASKGHGSGGRHGHGRKG